MKNKKIYIIPVMLFSFLLNANNTATAATLTFSTPQTSTLISETSGPFTSKVNYTPASWAPGSLNSATLRIFLSDDVSTTFFAPNIDAPREWASLDSISDGATVQNPNINVEVDPQLFDPATHGAANAATAAAAGIENPSVLPSMSAYFNLDVTALINGSNSGMLNFTLSALGLYPTILPGTPAHNLILTDALSLGITLPPDAPLPVPEDYLFNRAELTVQFGQPIPGPSAIILIGCGLLGLLFTRMKKV